MQLKLWRKERGLFLRTVAKKLKLSVATVSRYETEDRVSIPLRAMNRILVLTGGQVTANDFYGITPKKIAKLQARPPINFTRDRE